MTPVVDTRDSKLIVLTPQRDTQEPSDVLTSLQGDTRGQWVKSLCMSQRLLVLQKILNFLLLIIKSLCKQRLHVLQRILNFFSYYYYYYYYYFYNKFEPTITVIKAKTMHTLKHSLIPPMHLFAFWALTISVKVFRKGVISFSCNDLN